MVATAAYSASIRHPHAAHLTQLCMSSLPREITGDSTKLVDEIAEVDLVVVLRPEPVLHIDVGVAEDVRDKCHGIAVVLNLRKRRCHAPIIITEDYALSIASDVLIP